MAAQKPRLTHAEVGAWVLKCNSVAVWDYRTKMTNEGPSFGTLFPASWSLGRTYRNDLIEDGDLVMLMVSGGPDGSAVHEIGVVKDNLVANVIDPDYLIDGSREDVEEDFVEYEAVRLARPISRATFRREPVLAQSELIRAPQMTNPTYLTHYELAVLIKYFRPPDLRAAGWPTAGPKASS